MVPISLGLHDYTYNVHWAIMFKNRNQTKMSKITFQNPMFVYDKLVKFYSGGRM